MTAGLDSPPTTGGPFAGAHGDARDAFIEAWFVGALLRGRCLDGWRVPAVDDVYAALDDPVALDRALTDLGVQRARANCPIRDLHADVRALAVAAPFSSEQSILAFAAARTGWTQAWRQLRSPVPSAW